MTGLSTSILILAAVVPVAVPSLAAQEGQADARIAGQVVNRVTGRGISGVVVAIPGRAANYRTDLDGRYRSDPLEPGVYSLAITAIGYQPVRIDSILVRGGETRVVDVPMRPAVIQIEAITIEAQAVDRVTSEASLLSIQQAAAAVSDGVSAEAINRAPDSDAADAVARVTGVAVFDDKFVIVRGLPERYSNTLLNGSELTTPEPFRRVVPLDIFPSSLLESIVTTKSATPDRPGDFAGGSVNVTTRDFPDEFVFQVGVSGNYNSESTFRDAPFVPGSGTDFLGFDGGHRDVIPPDSVLGSLPPETGFEVLGESVRNVWDPQPRRVRPRFGFDVNVGGQTGPVGAVASLDYSSGVEHQPARLWRLYQDPSAEIVRRELVYREATRGVDWSAIGNVTFRLGDFHKVGIKNLYTRSAADRTVQNTGFDTEAGNLRSYQVAYHEQDFLQSQLTGDHLVGFFFRSRLEWKGTWSVSHRDEPDNRQVVYSDQDNSGRLVFSSNRPAQSWARNLRDGLIAGQVDWSFPITLWDADDAQFKVGGLNRRKDREFDARFFLWTLAGGIPNSEEIRILPPEQLFAPENVGTAVNLNRATDGPQSYVANDEVRAGYGMLDLPILRDLRFVGGVRLEDWRLNLMAAGDTVTRSNRDWLWSGNLTVSLTDRLNLRFAGYRSVSRPDTREVSNDQIVPVTGQCALQGSPFIQRALIDNGDARIEFYPRPGEIIALSGFLKRFRDPIVETIGIGDAGQCVQTPRNGESAENAGAEFEFRKTLDFLPGLARNLFFGVNATLVESNVRIPAEFGTYEEGLDLQGQSPFLLNLNLSYIDYEHGWSASVLANYYSDRIARYGIGAGDDQFPNLVEQGRTVVDAKLSRTLGRVSVSLAGRNLTNADVIFFHPASADVYDDGRAVAQAHRPGVSFSTSFGYDF